MIVNSHYVALQPPYPVIYSNGEVAMQTGTLIVVEGLDLPDPSAISRQGNISGPSMAPYRMRTHSHPVVSYGNKHAGVIAPTIEPEQWAEGIVWDNVEQRDVVILCHAPNGIPNDPASANNPGNSHWNHFGAKMNLGARLHSMVEREKMKDIQRGTARFKLNPIMKRLSLICPGCSITIKEPQGVVWLETALNAQRKDKWIIGGPDSPQSLPCLAIAAIQAETKELTIEGVKEQIEDYLNAVSADRNKVYIQFLTKNASLSWLANHLTECYSKDAKP